MGKLKPVFDFFLFSNIFVAFSFSCLAFHTFEIIYDEKDYYLILFIFCSSFFVYSFHHWFGLAQIRRDIKLSDRLQWIREHKKYLVLICMLLAPVIIFCSFKLSLTHVIALVPIGLIALGYTVPVIPGSGRTIGLREIPGLKIFIISFVISYVTVFLPAVSSGETILTKDTEMLFLFTERFLFVFAITIPFDIRDLVYDKIRMTKTIPVIFGEKRSKMLSFVSLGLCAVIIFLRFYSGDMDEILMAAMFISLVISGIFIFKTSVSSNEYFFSFWMDGMMVLQMILVYAAGKIILYW